MVKRSTESSFKFLSSASSKYWSTSWENVLNNKWFWWCDTPYNISIAFLVSLHLPEKTLIILHKHKLVCLFWLCKSQSTISYSVCLRLSRKKKVGKMMKKYTLRCMYASFADTCNLVISVFSCWQKWFTQKEKIITNPIVLRRA